MARRIIALDTVRLALSKSGERKKKRVMVQVLIKEEENPLYVKAAGFLEGFFFQ